MGDQGKEKTDGDAETLARVYGGVSREDQAVDQMVQGFFRVLVVHLFVQWMRDNGVPPTMAEAMIGEWRGCTERRIKSEVADLGEHCEGSAMGTLLVALAKPDETEDGLLRALDRAEDHVRKALAVSLAAVE